MTALLARAHECATHCQYAIDVGMANEGWSCVVPCIYAMARPQRYWISYGGLTDVIVLGKRETVRIPDVWCEVSFDFYCAEFRAVWPDLICGADGTPPRFDDDHYFFIGGDRPVHGFVTDEYGVTW